MRAMLVERAAQSAQLNLPEDSENSKLQADRRSRQCWYAASKTKVVAKFIRH
jgi:hypothetical protein